MQNRNLSDPQNLADFLFAAIHNYDLRTAGRLIPEYQDPTLGFIKTKCQRNEIEDLLCDLSDAIETDPANAIKKAESINKKYKLSPPSSPSFAKSNGTFSPEKNSNAGWTVMDGKDMPEDMTVGDLFTMITGKRPGF